MILLCLLTEKQLFFTRANFKQTKFIYTEKIVDKMPVFIEI